VTAKSPSNDDDESNYGEGQFSAQLNDADEYAQQQQRQQQRRLSDYSESGVMYGRRLSSQQGTDAEEQKRNWKDGDMSSDDDDGSDWRRDFEVRSQEPYSDYVPATMEGPPSMGDGSDSDLQSQVSESALDYIDKMYRGLGGDGDDDAKSVGAVPTEPKRDRTGKRGVRRKKTKNTATAKPVGRRFSMEASGASTRSLAEASLAAVSNMLNLDDPKDDDNIGIDPAEDIAMDIHGDQREKGAIELGLAEQLTSLDHEKQTLIDEMQTKLREKETDIENMERTTSEQAQQISQLQAELDQLREQGEEEEKKAAVPEMNDLRAEIEKNLGQAAMLERQVSDAEYRLEARKEREEVLTSELAQIQASIKTDDEDAAKQLEAMEEHLRKANASRAKYEEENRSMRQETDDILAKLRTNLYEILSEGGDSGNSDAFADLMTKFHDLREKEEELGKVLVLRMQERGEVVNALEAIKEIRNRTKLGEKAAQEVMQKLISSLNSINFDNKVLFSRFTKKDERAEAMKQRHQDAISSLEGLGEIQKETNASLGFVQAELLERLALLNWNKQQGDIAGNAYGTSFTTADGKAIVDTLEDAERAHKEAKARLDAIRDGIRTNLIGSVDSESVHSKMTTATSHSADDEEDEVFRLEDEISSKHERIESLQSTAEKLTEQIALLKKELVGIEEMGEADKTKSANTIERLQNKVKQAVTVSNERKKQISKLQATLEEKKKSEATLESELGTIKEEALLSRNDSDDMPDEDLPAALDHVGL